MIIFSYHNRTWDPCYYNETYYHNLDMTTENVYRTLTEKEGLYKAVFSRRDVRSHSIDKKIPDDVLVKILNVAHHAPSVGLVALQFYIDKE